MRTLTLIQTAICPRCTLSPADGNAVAGNMSKLTLKSTTSSEIQTELIPSESAETIEDAVASSATHTMLHILVPLLELQPTEGGATQLMAVSSANQGKY